MKCRATQAGNKIARRNINNLRYTGDTTLMAECEEELKSLLTKMKKESEKVILKLNIKKTKIMASGPLYAPMQKLYSTAHYGSKLSQSQGQIHKAKTQTTLPLSSRQWALACQRPSLVLLHMRQQDAPAWKSHLPFLT